MPVIDSEVIVCNEGEDLDGELSNEGNVVNIEDDSDMLCLDVSVDDDDKSDTNGDENIVVHHAVMLTVEMLVTCHVILLQ